MGTIGENIARIRSERGLSQERLAFKINKSKQSLYLLENDRIQKPDAITLQKIAEALDVSINELLSK